MAGCTWAYVYVKLCVVSIAVEIVAMPTNYMSNGENVNNEELNRDFGQTVLKAAAVRSTRINYVELTRVSS